MKKTGRLNRGLVKTVGIIVLTVFFVYSIAPIAPALIVSPIDVPSGSGLPAIDVDTFSISPDMGEIKYQHKGTSDKVIVHIQDAHCNYAAQKKIAEIIGFVNKEYGVREVNLEGGMGKYDLSVFTGMPDPEVRSKVADYFVKWGEVSGAELFGLMNPEKIDLWGVEDPGLYLSNLAVYRDSLPFKGIVDNILKRMKHLVNNLKFHIFSDELLQMDSKFAAYKTDNLDFKEYLDFLITKAREKGIEIKEFPDIYMLSHVMEEEEKINFKRAQDQREALVKALEARLPERDMKTLLKNTMDFSNKKMSQKDYYEYLFKQAKFAGQSVEDYPELHKYIVYVSMYSAVDKTAVMDEIDELESEIKKDMFRKDTERELDVLSRDLILLQNLFDFTFTKRDFDYFIKNRSSFDMDKYIAFAKRYAPEYGIDINLGENAVDLDVYRDKVAEFYEYSFKRDDAFVENLKVSGGDIKSGMIVMGGFHTENFLKLLEKRDVSYVSIVPNFVNEKGYESPYFKILAGGETNTFAKEVEAAFFSIQVPSLMNVLSDLADTDPAKKEVFRIRALVLETMIFEAGPKLVTTADGKYIVFSMKGDVPSVREYNKAEFDSSEYAGLEPVVNDVGFTKENVSAVIWALSRVAEANVKEMPMNMLLLPVDTIEKIKGLPGIGDTLDFVLDNRDIFVVEGLKAPVASNKAIYLPQAEEQVLISKLVHELVGGTFRGNGITFPNGHALASAVEKAVLAGDITEAGRILEGADRYKDGNTLWEMTNEEVSQAEGMDFSGFFKKDPLDEIIKKANENEESRQEKKENSRIVTEIFERFSEKARREEDAVNVVSMMIDNKKPGVSIMDLGSLVDLTIGSVDSGNWNSYKNLLNAVLRESESSIEVKGFGDIIKEIVKEGGTFKTINDLFYDDVNILSEAAEKARKGVNRFIADNDGRGYVLIRGKEGERQPLARVKPLYKAGRSELPSSRIILRQIARNDIVRDTIITDGNVLGFLQNMLRAYNENVEDVGTSVENIKKFINNYFEKSEGYDFLGAIKGNRLLTAPEKMRTSERINSLDLEGVSGTLMSTNVFRDTVFRAIGNMKAPADRKTAFKKALLAALGQEVTDALSRISGESDMYNLLSRMRSRTTNPDIKKELENIIALKAAVDTGTRDRLNYIKNKRKYPSAYETSLQNNLKAFKAKGVKSVDGSQQTGDLIEHFVASVSEEKRDDMRREITRLRNETILFHLKVEDVVERLQNNPGLSAIKKALGGLLAKGKIERSISGKNIPVYVRRVGVGDVKDIYGRSFVIGDSPLAEPTEEIIPDSYILRGKDGSYTIIIVDVPDLKQADISNSVGMAVEKIEELDRLINALQTPRLKKVRIADLFGKDEIKEGISADNIEKIKNLNDMIYKYHGRNDLEGVRDMYAALYKMLFVESVRFPSGGEFVFDPKTVDIDSLAYAAGFLPNEKRLKLAANSAIGKLEMKGGTIVTGGIGEVISVSDEGGSIILDKGGKVLENGEIKLVHVDGAGAREGFVDSLRELVSNDGLTNNTLTVEEKGQVGSLISRLEGKEIVVYSGGSQNDLFGFFYGGKVYLDETMLIDPLSLLHEMGEGGMIVMPEGYADLNAHTYMRGVGKKTRAAVKELGNIKPKDAKDLIDKINQVRKDGPVPDPEAALIEYNFEKINTLQQEDQDAYQRALDLGMDFYMEGIQGSIDPARNVGFTNWMRMLKTGMRRGVHNFIVLPAAAVEIESRLARLSKIAKKEGEAKLGVNLTFVMQKEGKDGLLEELSETIKRAEVLAEGEKEKLGKVFVDLIDVDGKTSEKIRDSVNDDITVVVNDNLPEGDVPKIDIAKLVMVASSLLDDKRKTTDFGMSPDELMESRRELIRALENGGVLSPESIVGYDLNSAEGLDEVINGLFSGVISMTITKVNWEEIRDWYESNVEVMRSL